MILIDSRAGSQDLVAPLAAAGLPVETTTLEFGDLTFLGRGEGEKTVSQLSTYIGIEHKKLPDLVQSLVNDRLAGHQLTGMLATYDRSYLIIEGEWDTDSRGRVTVPGRFKGARSPLKGCPPASVLRARVWTLEHRGGLRVYWSRNQKDTVAYVSTLYRCWTDRSLDEHRSHLAIHAPDLDRALRENLCEERVIAAMFPGVGYTRSGAVVERFDNLHHMVNAPVADWMEVDGIGKVLANRLTQFFRRKREWTGIRSAQSTCWSRKSSQSLRLRRHHPRRSTARPI